MTNKLWAVEIEGSRGESETYWILAVTVGQAEQEALKIAKKQFFIKPHCIAANFRGTIDNMK